MPWYYTQMSEWHVLLAWCSIGLFFSRGLLWQFGTTRLQGIARDSRLQVLAFGVNFCLLITGIGLWGALGYHPLRQDWLGLKLIALLGYAVCSHWAMTPARLHLLGYLGALVMLALAMQLSVQRSLLGTG